MNYADSARIKSILTNCWFSSTENIQEANIIIFDTCSVRQKSEDKITGKLKEIRPDQKVWITWCMVQHNLRNNKINDKKLPENLKRGNFLWTLQTKHPEIIGVTAEEVNTHNTEDTKQETIWINHSFNPLFYRLTQKWTNIELFFRIDDTWFLPLILQKIGYKIRYDQEVTNEYLKIIPDGFNTSMNHHQKTAYIPISTGCNQFCSYCIVPYARWLEKHHPKEYIIQEAKHHINAGCKEIVLLGQIVNKHPEFLEIIKELLWIEWLVRLRYTSPYPNFYTPELLKLHETKTKLCPHIHIPLQSGSDTILKSMHRGYSVQEAKTFIDNIKNIQRDISITTDIIVGYPGETEKDFEATLDLVEYGKFDMIYIGIYSPRPWTYSHKHHPDTIDRKTKRSRRDRLNELLKKTSTTNNQAEIGHIRTVIIDKIDGQKYYWYTDNMKQISIKKSEYIYQIWDFIKVKIIKALPFKLYWEIVEKK
jgi:tRNA-2-methylthio-N6-dimethylallyladenosine synthase